MSFVRLHTTHSFGAYNTDGLNCTICQEDFESPEHVFTHEGQGAPHTFHLHCIQHWLTSAPSCPSCRLPISHVNGERIGPIPRMMHTHVNGVPDINFIQAQVAPVIENDDDEAEGQEAFDFRRLDTINTFAQESLANLQCTICLDAITEDDHAYAHEGPGATPHAFHLSCINSWFVERHNECPICRGPASHASIAAVAMQAHTQDSIIEASQAGNLELIQELIAIQDLSRNDRGRAVEAAALGNHLQSVQVLLEGGDITEHYRGRAVGNAVHHGNLEIVQALLANGPISQADRTHLLGQARAHNLGPAIIAALRPNNNRWCSIQ